MSRHKTRICRHKQEMSRHIPLCINSYWVDLGFFRNRKQNESTYPIMCRLILLCMPQNKRMKGAWVDTKHICVDTNRCMSRHIPLCIDSYWVYLNFFRNMKWHVLTQRCMCRHIMVKTYFFPFFYTVFMFSIYFFIAIQYVYNN